MNRVWPIVSGPFAPLVLVILVVGALFAFRFFPSQPQMIDRYPVGEVAACGDSCAVYASTAARWLDTNVPRHPPVVSTAFYVPDLRGPDGGRIPLGSGAYIVAMTLGDGSIRAVFVSCGVGAGPGSCAAGPLPIAPTGDRAGARRA